MCGVCCRQRLGTLAKSHMEAWMMYHKLIACHPLRWYKHLLVQGIGLKAGELPQQQWDSVPGGRDFLTGPEHGLELVPGWQRGSEGLVNEYMLWDQPVVSCREQKREKKLNLWVSNDYISLECYGVVHPVVVELEDQMTHLHSHYCGITAQPAV